MPWLTDIGGSNEPITLCRVKCGIETSTQNVDQRSLWLVSAPCRLDQRAISAPSVQRCAEGQCSSSHQFYIIAIILVVLCAVTTAAWLIACWNRPKMKHIKSWINGFSRPERLTDNYSSSRTCTTLPVPTALHSSMKKQAPLINTLVGSVDHSLDAPNLDDLLRERAETKKRLDMDEVSDSSLKKPAATMPTYSIFKSIDSNVIQFPSLDDLPEPPHITVGEIHELNRALNAPRLLEPRPLQRTTTANSVNSVGTTRTIDPIQRRASIASTVDFRPPVFLKNLLNLPKPTSKISFSPDPLKLFSRLSTASSSSSLDITSSGDQKLYSILQDLRKSTAQKEAEIAKTAAENDTKWLKLLSNN
ncbi:unnamed protein product [Bursaphelenchus xylophilus]|uniref:(pine wood nematode) hypothetical protein n=1 Tax=Bursaphelenchus xylophilus TaxID=6326 RepID=A0A7I8X856_BURXY|nr:unnamed protein product [Bursaphelenchus xylophilus]CAG9119352.1 unnamed protein product [Bursaphelenchus xylophilus]